MPLQKLQLGRQKTSYVSLEYCRRRPPSSTYVEHTSLFSLHVYLSPNTCFIFNFGLLTRNYFILAKFCFIFQNGASTTHQERLLIYKLLS
jgi:hypothetical protein